MNLDHHLNMDQICKPHLSLCFKISHLLIYEVSIVGGGGLALYGTGNLHTWAQSLEEIIPRFTDTRKMDRTKFMDDSAYRYGDIFFCIELFLCGFRL